MAVSSPNALGWREDAEFLREALYELHPGRTRYQTEGQEKRQFEALLKGAARAGNIQEFHGQIAKYLAGFRCGHTHVNPYNQIPAVVAAVYDGPDKLPFLFSWIDREMVVTYPRSSGLQRGDRIVKLQGKPASQILKKLTEYARADGGRDNKRAQLMSLNGAEFDEADAYFPIVAPPKENHFDLEVIGAVSKEKKKLKVRAVQRRERVEAPGPKPASSLDEMWKFQIIDNRLAVLELPHFVSWRMKLDWKAFLTSAFEQIRTQKIESLMIDLRGCEGGANDVPRFVASRILTSKMDILPFEYYTSYQKVSKKFSSAARTWDQSVYDLSKRSIPMPDGRFKSTDTELFKTLLPAENAFKGKVWVAIDSSNSSGGFLTAWQLQKSGRVTLIGEETGGSRRGLNAGTMLFITLPSSKLVVDIPLFAAYPPTSEPDLGIRPDVGVKVTAQDIARAVDPVLDYVLARS